MNEKSKSKKNMSNAANKDDELMRFGHTITLSKLKNNEK